MDDEHRWTDDGTRHYSDRDSDDSPLLSQRFRRLVEYPPAKVEERERRSTLTVLTKFFLFCSAMIMFCVVMYIPVYNRANDQMSKGFVAGWSMDTNRDTKIYIQPNNVTTIHEPKSVCPSHGKNKLFLLVVVCSSTEGFTRRLAIRQTWGNYSSYLQILKVNHAVKSKYLNYNFTYDLYQENNTRVKRDISVFNKLLPALADAIRERAATDKTDNAPENRFEDESDNMLPEFDMDAALAEQTETIYDYYDTNIMKIAPRGHGRTPDLSKLITMLKSIKNFPELEELSVDSDSEPEFKLVFLLGLPNKNDSRIQNEIDREVEKFGDVIQEDFIDTYNNLTLKSIMMLKWIKNNCNDSVRYILKTDDDMYMNMANLMDDLKNMSRQFDAGAKSPGQKEYLLMGSRISGSKPVQDTKDKWFSPKYMYQGRVYPRYLSGTAYALSGPAAAALYGAALRTPYFHLEDIYITGMCAGRAVPRLSPRDDPLFVYTGVPRGAAPCAAHGRATLHRVTPRDLRRIHRSLNDPRVVDLCERKRLTKIKHRRHIFYALYKFLGLVDSNEY